MKSPSLRPPAPTSPTIKRRRLQPASPSHISTPADTVTPATPSPLKPKRPLSLAQWHPLRIPKSELSLPLTLPTGQTFRWRRTGPTQFTGVVGPHLVSLKHADADGNVSCLLHHTFSPASFHSDLSDYLNLGVSLSELWRGWGEVDARFAELARRFGGGVRVLRQDPVECLFQFLCSSNNNIGRIEKMVGVISGFGEYLGSVGGFEFHRFPTIDRLAAVSEAEFREAGFGYRAKYIVGTVKALQSKSGGGEEWLASLRVLELPEVIDALCTLPGVGPKVAACIALFSLDQHHAIPVDTHVWQIAARYYVPELASVRPSPRLFGRVTKAFETRFGKYAGWAQTVLFIGELPSQKALKTSKDGNIEENSSGSKTKDYPKQQSC